MKNWRPYFVIIFTFIFWLFVAGLFTNWFGFYHSNSRPPIIIDCKKDTSSQYCDGEFDEHQYDKMDNAGRTITP